MKLKDLLKDAYKEGMSLEDIEAALADIDLPSDGSAEIERLKSALTKSNAENAEWKRKSREAKSEDERKAEETQELIAQLTKERDDLKHDADVAKNKATYIALGYDEKLATSAAEAMVSGDMDKVLQCQKQHLDGVQQKVKSDLLKSMGKPVGDDGGSGMTLARLREMTPAERYEFAQKNPDEYKNLYGGN